LLPDQGELVSVDSLDDALASSLSEAAGNDLLLTFIREQEVAGSLTLRAYSSLVTISDDALGGASGASGAGGVSGAGAAGDSAGGGGERGDVPGGGVDGTDRDPSAGQANAAGSAIEGRETNPSGGAGTASPGPRNSKGCGCRASSEPPGSALLSVLALLVAATRRRFSSIGTQQR
jgi:MYXO-CTERM domain-containing protein